MEVVYKIWGWIQRNHQALGALGAVATITAVLISLISLTHSADQFGRQIYEQKRATSVAIVSDFISEVGSFLLNKENIRDGDKFDRLIVTRTELLTGSLEYPELINQIIYFLGTNELGRLFDLTRAFNGSPFISLSNIKLSGTKMRDVELDMPELYCSDLSGIYFSNVKLNNPVFHYSNLSGANIVNSHFRHAQVYWSNLSNISIELTVGAAGNKDDSDLSIFNDAEILFSNLRGLTITKVKNTDGGGVANNGAHNVEGIYRHLARLLSKAKSLYGSQLDDQLKEKLEMDYPEKYKQLFSISGTNYYKSLQSINSNKKREGGGGERRLKVFRKRYEREKKRADSNWDEEWRAKKNVRCEG